MKFDFSGWATKNDIVCGDGRIIRRDAFKDNDGEIVPLVWNHQHNDVRNVLGHALLKNTPDGVRTYLCFNDTENGREAKKMVSHGDIRSLSIFANHLKQKGADVLHGAIKEVSLVLAGANPGARIDEEGFAHSADGADAWMVYTPDLPLELFHSEEEYDEDEDYDDEYEESEEDCEDDVEDSDDYDDSDDEGDDEDDDYDDDSDHDEESDGEMAHSDDEVMDPKKIYNSMNEEQKTLVHYMVGKALEEDSDEEEEKELKHNAFENEPVTGSKTVISHSDETAILDLAKKSGSFQDAYNFYCEENGILKHDDIAPSSGFVQPPTSGNITEVFPEYHNIGPAAPELVTDDQTWIPTVINGVKKSPFQRVRTRFVDIRHIQELRAKGYEKGTKKKLTGNFNLVKRETDPQTVYVKNALHKDDITDITDFDYVQYMYNIDKMMLNEEIATAILLGDGRDIGDEDKIKEDHIRPIWTDDELYTIHYDINFAAAKAELQGTNTGANFGDNFIHCEAMVNACLYAREDYKGSGQPVMYIHPHELNVMLLARDLNGRRIYSGVSELASALNVSKIITVEQFENRTRTDATTGKTKKLLALIVNLNDYNVGQVKGGEISHFTQFDIDYNQEKSLIETRLSGALIRIKSAIAIEEEVNL